MTTAAPARTIRAPRQYDSPLRRRQAAETRERIVTGGCDLLRQSSIRDWRALTIRGVARQAGVNERTVYRYFTNERGLRDAVMARHEQQAGIDLAGMRLQDIADVARRILTHVSSYPRETKPPLDPTLTQAAVRQRAALHDALEEWTGGWSDAEQAAVAAMFDVLWSVATYERLSVDWELDERHAIDVVTWVMRLIEEAMRAGRAPGR